MKTASTEPSVHAKIANRLTVQLVIIGVCAAFVNGLFAIVTQPLGPIAFFFIAAVNVVVLWLVVQAVFGALDDLLEAKLGSRE